MPKSTVVPAPLVEKSILTPVNCFYTFEKTHLNIFVCLFLSFLDDPLIFEYIPLWQWGERHPRQVAFLSRLHSCLTHKRIIQVRYNMYSGNESKFMCQIHTSTELQAGTCKSKCPTERDSLQRLSFSVKVLCLSVIVTEAPFPSIGPSLSHVQFRLWCSEHLAILVRLLQKPLFSAQYQGLSSPPVLFCLWCSGPPSNLTKPSSGLLS